MEEFYQDILATIRNKKLDNLVIKLTKYTPYLTASLYLLVLIYLIFNNQKLIFGYIIKPATAFMLVTLIRKLWNRPRPYESLNINPLIKHKSGESFPSRHTVSAYAIAFAIARVLPLVGTVALIIAFLVAITRILAGLHYPGDVIGAIIIAYLINII